MPTDKQRPHPSGRVVSVRLDDQTIRRLDALAERTSRSRGVYRKLAIRAVLPSLERMHWEDVAKAQGAITATCHSVTPAEEIARALDDGREVEEPVNVHLTDSTGRPVAEVTMTIVIRPSRR